MIPIGSAHASLRNLASTYTNLAQGMPGAQIQRQEYVWSAQGEFAHAGCNFAVGLRWESDEVEGITQLAGRRPCFQLYELAGTRDSYVALQAGGWTRSYTLANLVCEVPQSKGQLLLEAQTSAEKRAIAEFMSLQFLSGQPHAVRQMIVGATASGEGFRFFTLGDDSGLMVGAVMLNTFGGCVGMYNLCVAEGSRGRGVGRAIVDGVLNLFELPVSLQCEPRLAGWYGRSGFRDVGSVEAYVLAQDTI